MDSRICLAMMCLLMGMIQVSDCKQKKKPEGLLAIPRCMGKRVPSSKYNQAVKACRGKKTEMCSYMCMASRMKFLKNKKIQDKEQRLFIEEILPKAASAEVYKEIKNCRKYYNATAKDGQCHWNHEWAKCNKAAEVKGCRNAEKH